MDDDEAEDLADDVADDPAGGADVRDCAPVPLDEGVVAPPPEDGCAAHAVSARASAHSTPAAAGRTGRSAKRRTRIRTF
jgi:hypothetical protein